MMVTFRVGILGIKKTNKKNQKEFKQRSREYFRIFNAI